MDFGERRFSPKRGGGTARRERWCIGVRLRCLHSPRGYALSYVLPCYVHTVHGSKSEIAQDRLRQPSAYQIAALTRATPAIYQSYLPNGRNYPAYIAHRTRTPTYKHALHTPARATIDVRSRHRTSPWSTRYVMGKASECRRRPRSDHVGALSTRRDVAHGVLRSSPTPEHTIVFA